MKTLIIDTTKKNMFVGLNNDGVRSTLSLDGLKKHNETLLNSIDKLLNQSNLTLQNLDYIALNIGAGSFTGIRVGVSTVKAFCVALKNLKCISFNSLELLAYSSNVKGDFLALISAGTDNMYVAECLNNSVISQKHFTLEEFNSLKPKTIVALKEEKDILPIQPNVYVENLKYFELVEEKIEGNNLTDIKSLQPLYLRLSQAERELALKNENANSN